MISWLPCGWNTVLSKELTRLDESLTFLNEISPSGLVTLLKLRFIWPQAEVFKLSCCMLPKAAQLGLILPLFNYPLSWSLKISAHIDNLISSGIEPLTLWLVATVRWPPWPLRADQSPWSRIMHDKKFCFTFKKKNSHFLQKPFFLHFNKNAFE